MKKKIDDRIRILLENCVKLNQRGLVIIVGDRAIYQVPITLNIMIYIDCKSSLHAFKGKNKAISINTMVL